MREQSSVELAEMVRDDELDLAFLSVTEARRAGGAGCCTSSSPRSWSSCCRAVALAGRAPVVRMADLAGEEFISYREGARLRELLESAGRSVGFSPRVTLESNESGRIRRLVHRARRGDPAAVGCGACRGRGRRHRDLVEPSLTRDITLAWREGRRLGPAAAAFLELSLETFAPAGPPKR